MLRQHHLICSWMLAGAPAAARSAVNWSSMAQSPPIAGHPFTLSVAVRDAAGPCD